MSPIRVCEIYSFVHVMRLLRCTTFDGKIQMISSSGNVLSTIPSPVEQHRADLEKVPRPP